VNGGNRSGGLPAADPQRIWVNLSPGSRGGTVPLIGSDHPTYPTDRAGGLSHYSVLTSSY